jgi:hypothetical protein
MVCRDVSVSYGEIPSFRSIPSRIIGGATGFVESCSLRLAHCEVPRAAFDIPNMSFDPGVSVGSGEVLSAESLQSHPSAAGTQDHRQDGDPEHQSANGELEVKERHRFTGWRAVRADHERKVGIRL